MLSYPKNKITDLKKGEHIWLFLLDDKTGWWRYPEDCGHLYGKWAMCTVSYVGQTVVALIINDSIGATYGEWFYFSDMSCGKIKNVDDGPFKAMWSFYDPSNVKEPKPIYGPQTCKGYLCPDPVNPYAEPNQPDGSFLCYTCRSVWRPKTKKYDFPDIGTVIKVPV